MVYYVCIVHCVSVFFLSVCHSLFLQFWSWSFYWGYPFTFTIFTKLSLIIIMSSASLSIVYQRSRIHSPHSPHCFCSLTDQFKDFPFSTVCTCRFDLLMQLIKMIFVSHAILSHSTMPLSRPFSLSTNWGTQRLRSMKTLCSHQSKLNINESAFFDLFHQHHKPNRTVLDSWKKFLNEICFVIIQLALFSMFNFVEHFK